MSRVLRRVPFTFKWPRNKVYYVISKVSGKRTHPKPPRGAGFQLWENCSEGSPISPIFKTLDELCEWAEEHATTFADFKTTKEKWKQMLLEDNVHHREGNIIFI